jgi:hypothetical protein
MGVPQLRPLMIFAYYHPAPFSSISVISIRPLIIIPSAENAILNQKAYRQETRS